MPSSASSSISLTQTDLRPFARLWNDSTTTERLIFFSTLFLKLVAGMSLGSHYSNDLFIPFIDYFVSSHFSNPWAHFSTTLPDAFPYSGAMLFFLALPRFLLSPFIEAGSLSATQYLSLRLPLLAADLIILRTLTSWFPTRRLRILLLWWCSPVVFYISYLHGQLDSLPTAFVLLSLAALLRKRYFWSGIFYGIAIASKFHVLAIAPFLFLYILKRPETFRQRRLEIGQLFLGISVPLLTLVIPLAFDPHYRKMVFGEGESRAVFAYFISISPVVKFYLCPAALFALGVKFFTYLKANRDLLILYCGLVFATLVLLLPPAPGWYFWSMPFIVYFFVRQNRANLISYFIFSLVYFTYYLMIDVATKTQELTSSFAAPLSLAFTGLQTTLAVIIFWIYREGVQSNAVYKPIRKPLSIGIGGDSSTGKDTLANGITYLLGAQNVCQVNGDDYHKWPRGHEAWKEYTHLNPGGNNLHLPVSHLQNLKQGQVISKASYDHSTGNFTAPVDVEPRHFNLYIGLHPFYLPRMRRALNIKIFMETDERLRLAWKVDRDSKERGYSEEQVVAQIEKRKPDGDRYIRPQKRFADLIIRYGYATDIFTDSADESLAVQYTLWSDINLESLIEKLRELPHLKIEWDYLPDLERQQINLCGHTSAENIESIAHDVFSNLEDVVLNRPLWQDGIKGINQLVAVALLADFHETKFTS